MLVGKGSLDQRCKSKLEVAAEFKAYPALCEIYPFFQEF